MLCSYHSQVGSNQYTWAIQQFKAFNRAATPWLFVLHHAPIYHTYVNHYKVGNNAAWFKFMEFGVCHASMNSVVPPGLGMLEVCV